MQFNKTNVSNPMLVGTIELLKAEPTPEHNKMFVGELMKADCLIPVVLTPMPETDAEGNIKPADDTKMQFPMLTTPDGKHFFAVYTDRLEFEKRKDAGNESQVAATVKFEEVMLMALRRDSTAFGAVINPFSSNIVIGKEMMAGIMGPRIAKMQANRQASDVKQP